MCDYVTIAEIKSWDMDSRGRYVNPDETIAIKLGYNVGSSGSRVTVGNSITIGNNVWIDNDVVIGDDVIIGDNVSIGSNTNIGTHVLIGDCVINIGNNVTIDAFSTIKEYSVIYDHVKIKGNVTINRHCIISEGTEIGDLAVVGAGSRLGRDVVIGNNVVLPENICLKDGETTRELARYFRELWKARGDTVIFTKWVTKERMSPNFYGGVPIKYIKGETVEVEDCEESDQQCDAGLHVLEFGHQPEWYGLCSSWHELIPIRVEVKTDDILFGGLPGMVGKYRVRKLKVLD